MCRLSCLPVLSELPPTYVSPEKDVTPGKDVSPDEDLSPEKGVSPDKDVLPDKGVSPGKDAVPPGLLQPGSKVKQQQLAPPIAQLAALPSTSLTAVPCTDMQQQQEQQQMTQAHANQQHSAAQAVLPSELPADLNLTQASDWASVPEPESQHELLDSQLHSSPVVDAFEASAAAVAEVEHMPADAAAKAAPPLAAVACIPKHASPVTSSSPKQDTHGAATGPDHASNAASSPSHMTDAIQHAAERAAPDQGLLPAGLNADQAAASPVTHSAHSGQKKQGTLQPAGLGESAIHSEAAPQPHAIGPTGSHGHEFAAAHSADRQPHEDSSRVALDVASQSASYKAAEVLTAMATGKLGEHQTASLEQAGKPKQAQQNKDRASECHDQSEPADRSGQARQPQPCASSRLPLQVVQCSAAVQRQPMKGPRMQTGKAQMTAWGAKGKRKHGSQHAVHSRDQQPKKSKAEDVAIVPSIAEEETPAHEVDKQQTCRGSKPSSVSDVAHVDNETVSSRAGQQKRKLSSKHAANPRSTTASPADGAAQQLSSDHCPKAPPQAGSDNDNDSDSDDFIPVQRGRAMASSGPAAPGTKRRKACEGPGRLQGAAKKDMLAGQVYLQWNGHARQWDQQMIGPYEHAKVSEMTPLWRGTKRLRSIQGLPTQSCNGMVETPHGIGFSLLL